MVILPIFHEDNPGEAPLTLELAWCTLAYFTNLFFHAKEAFGNDELRESFYEHEQAKNLIAVLILAHFKLSSTYLL